jgi:hypothetical protein
MLRTRTRLLAVLLAAGLAVPVVTATGSAEASPTWVDLPDVLDTGDQVTQLMMTRDLLQPFDGTS